MSVRYNRSAYSSTRHCQIVTRIAAWALIPKEMIAEGRCCVFSFTLPEQNASIFIIHVFKYLDMPKPDQLWQHFRSLFRPTGRYSIKNFYECFLSDFLFYFTLIRLVQLILYITQTFTETSDHIRKGVKFDCRFSLINLKERDS